MAARSNTGAGLIASGRRIKCKGDRVVARLFSILGSLLIAAALATPATAQAPYPSRPIRVVVPFGPGGFADITMRLVGQKLAERTGQQVVIENRPSAGGIVAAAVVTSAPPDGYTLFVLSSGIALSKSLLKTMPFDPVTAFSSISTMALFDLLLLVRADSPMRTIKDALELARRDPGGFNIGTINPGSTQNVSAELLRSVTGLPMTIVPHRNTGEVLASLLRGDTKVAVESYAALKSAIDGGQARAIAATGDVRSPMQPNVATLKEGGLDAVVVGWNALVAPAHTSKEIVSYLNGHVRAIIESAEFQKRMLELGGEPKASTPAELDARLKSDIDMWAAVVRKAGLQPR
jgi:tripartite-type tricarboxylate transporter receptor subunit TctC